jgi:hypothetical protein
MAQRTPTVNFCDNGSLPIHTLQPAFTTLGNLQHLLVAAHQLTALAHYDKRPKEQQWWKQQA